ncbi:MAG: hypothetical protein FWF79_06270 [Defluviitaleaceae bacterium]|nr:hypothetical protein [Defluviitaleaceae bacterium]
MQSFNESLSTFLVECRESALGELKKNAQYVERLKAKDELLTQIEAHLPPEGITLFEEYRDIVTATMSLEYNQTLIFGLTTQNSISKRFDPSSPEFHAFVATFLNTTAAQPS